MENETEEKTYNLTHKAVWLDRKIYMDLTNIMAKLCIDERPSVVIKNLIIAHTEKLSAEWKQKENNETLSLGGGEE